MKAHTKEVVHKHIAKNIGEWFKLINHLKYMPALLDTNLFPAHLFHLVKPNAGKQITK